MFRRIAIGTLLSASAIVLACGSETKSEFGSSSGNDAGSSSGILNTKDSGPAPPAVECRKMDIVFAVDNSDSMKEEQANLAKNFPEFIRVINEYKTQQGEELDYRLAVVNSDTTDAFNGRGEFRKSRGTNPYLDAGDPLATCNPGPNNNPWLVRTDTSVADFFACRAQVGTVGSNVERPLESIRLGLTDRIADGINTMNGASFIREDALLALVILTDEDEGSADGDPSVTPAPAKEVTAYTSDFDALKIYRGRWASAVIAGDRECASSTLGKAANAVRLKQFVTQAGENSVFHSICDGDLASALTDALNTFTKACKDFPGVK